MTATRAGCESFIDEVAATTAYNLGVVHGELNRLEEAVTAFVDVLARDVAPATRTSPRLQAAPHN